MVNMIGQQGANVVSLAGDGRACSDVHVDIVGELHAHRPAITPTYPHPYRRKTRCRLSPRETKEGKVGDGSTYQHAHFAVDGK